MIDNNKIEEAANKHIETEYARYNSGEVEQEMICLRGKDSFKAGAKWAINEFLTKYARMAIHLEETKINGYYLLLISRSLNLQKMARQFVCNIV